jgi:predicted lipoprotein with Yx(FWY)xxD motif
MSARSPLIATAAVLGVLALVAAGCGGGDSSSSSAPAVSATSSSTTAPTTAAGSGGAATIDVADNPDLGQILTDGDGNTVYLFEKDEDGTSNCSGECATEWPPVTTTGSAKAGNGADQSLISTIKRDDGSMQVTYDGHPLYLYVGDAKPGDASGNGLSCTEPSGTRSRPMDRTRRGPETPARATRRRARPQAGTAPIECPRCAPGWRRR